MMTFKTIIRNLNGKAVLYVGSGGIEYPSGNEMILVRFKDQEFTLKASYWLALSPWCGPYGLVERTGSLLRAEKGGKHSNNRRSQVGMLEVILGGLH